MKTKSTFKISVLIFFVIMSLNISAQEKISLDPSEDWIEFQRDEVMNSIYNKYSFSEIIVKELQENGNSNIQLLGYYTNEKKGIYRSNLQVLIRPNSAKNIKDLKLEIEKSLEEFAKVIKEFKIVKEPTILKIDNKEAIIIKFKGYNLNNENKKSSFETTLIAVPTVNTFYQITLNQSTEDQLDVVFKMVIDSIKFQS